MAVSGSNHRSALARVLDVFDGFEPWRAFRMSVLQMTATPNRFAPLTGPGPRRQSNLQPPLHRHERLVLFLRRPPAGVACYTPQVSPSKPMVTSLPATMTGTLRTPSECLSIASMLADDSSTSRYSTSFPSFAKASRAARVCGQVFLPKTITLSAISFSSLFLIAVSVPQHRGPAVVFCTCVSGICLLCQ